MNEPMKSPYIKPTCVIIDIAIQHPCLLSGSYNVNDLDYEYEQEVGGDG